MSGRIRTVKPEWNEDELLAAASDEARVLSIGLILLADDYGNGRASIATIAATVWRYALERDDGANAPAVLAKASRAFRELLAIGFVGCWTVSGQRYFAIRNWTKHQRVDKPGKRMVPEPPKSIFAEQIEYSRASRESVASDSGDIPESLAPDQRPTTNEIGPTTTTREPASGVVAKAPALVPCPPDLCLTAGQRSALKIGVGMNDYQIDQLQASFCAGACSNQGDLRPIDAWRKCMAKAVAGDFSNPRRRPPASADAPESDDQVRRRLRSGPRQPNSLDHSTHAAHLRAIGATEE